ncbi:MAG: hypothetical protein V4735_02420 [Pseudomonadota bacterium]
MDEKTQDTAPAEVNPYAPYDRASVEMSHWMHGGRTEKPANNTAQEEQPAASPAPVIPPKPRIFARFDKNLRQLEKHVTTLGGAIETPLQLSDKTRSALEGYLIAVASGEAFAQVEIERAPLAAIQRGEQMDAAKLGVGLVTTDYSRAVQNSFKHTLTKRLEALARDIVKENSVNDIKKGNSGEQIIAEKLTKTLLALDDRIPQLRGLKSIQAELKVQLDALQNEGTTDSLDAEDVANTRAYMAAHPDEPLIEHYSAMLEKSSAWLKDDKARHKSWVKRGEDAPRTSTPTPG